MNAELTKFPPMGLGECLIGDEEIELVTEVIRKKSPFRYYSNQLPAGEKPRMVASLERAFRERTGASYAHAVTSGTAALEVALGALGIGPGDEVIIPVWSWISCFTAVVRAGARPVLAEIDETLCIDPDEIPRLATDRTKAVMVVHYQGVGADMNAILCETKKLGLRVLEDVAEACGASYNGQQLGTIGDIGIFSFQSNKVITSGEGGMVITNDGGLYERVVRMSDLGNFRPFHEEFLKPSGEVFAGGNFRFGELPAAMALAQIRKLDGMISHLRKLRDILVSTIRDQTSLRLRKIPDESGDMGFESYIFLESAEEAKALTRALNEAGVNCNKHTGTYCHFAREYCINGKAHHPAASPFRVYDKWPAKGYREEDFPQTRKIVEAMVALPIGALYTEEHVSLMAKAIIKAAGKLNRN